MNVKHRIVHFQRKIDRCRRGGYNAGKIKSKGDGTGVARTSITIQERPETRKVWSFFMSVS
jgi:hypothetical protein